MKSYYKIGLIVIMIGTLVLFLFCIPVYSNLSGVLLYSDETICYLCDCTVENGILSFNDYSIISDKYCDKRFIRLKNVDVESREISSGSIVNVRFKIVESLFDYIFSFDGISTIVSIDAICVMGVLSSEDYNVLSVYPDVYSRLHSVVVSSGLTLPNGHYALY